MGNRHLSDYLAGGDIECAHCGLLIPPAVVLKSLDAMGTPGTTRSMGWVRLRACTSRLLVNAEDDRAPLVGLYRSQQRL